MFKDERRLARRIASKIRSEPHLSVKFAISGDAMPKKDFEDVLSRYFGAHAPMYVARPGIIVVAEDAKRFEKNLRRAFREIGQPLRYYLYGFDSAILWHVFEEGADEGF